MDKPSKRVMIVGGGNIGRRLAKALEHDYQVKLIEHNKKTCAETGRGTDQHAGIERRWHG